MKVRILGCGPSNGTPSLSRGFSLCNPNNPKNFRTRSSVLITTNKQKNILIDTGPDVRAQLLKMGSRPQIDAILYTHIHFDHMGGLNDIYGYLYDQKKIVDVFLDKNCAAQFKHQLDFVFKRNEFNPFVLHIISENKEIQICEENVIPIKQYHGNIVSIGYRIGDLAYSTDLKTIDETSFKFLQGIKTWILGVVSTKENNKHLHLDEALELVKEIKPEKVYLTHMGGRMDYDMLAQTLPQHIEPCYDGMEFDC